MTIRLRYVGHKSNRMLGEAIKRAGGALHAAANDFNQSLAIITAGNTNIQDPQSVSQLLKTMTMRLRGASAKDLQELGLDTEGMTDGKKSIVQLYKSMAGIDIMEGTNYKSTYQILDELYEKWDSLNDAQHAAISEMTGGKRAGSVFASLMTNWEDARKVVEAAERGMTEHSAQKELENASKSVEFSLQRVRAAAQELAYDFLSSDFLKGAIEAFARFIEVLDKVGDATHGVVPAVTAAAGAFYAFSTINGLMKTLGAGMKMLQKATDTETKSTLAQIAAKVKQIIAERALAKAKKDTAKASVESTVAQKAETSAQQADIATNGSQALSEAAKNYEAAPGKSLQYFGERPLTPVAEGTKETATAFSSVGLAGGALIAVLAAVAATAYMVYQRNEQLKESASQLASAYTASTAELDGYKEQISNLYDTINDSTTSYEDAKAAREQLLSIQDALIAKYGEEAGNIDLVTQAVDGQIEALDQLRDREWQRTKTEFNKKAGLGILDSINQTMHGASSNMEVMEDEVFDAKIKVRATAIDDKEFLQQMEEALGGEYEVDMNAGILTLSGDLDDVKDKLYQIQDAAEKVGASDNFMSGLTKNINDVEDTLSKYGEMADQWVFNEKVMPSYSDQFHDMQNAYQEYRDAVTDNNAELIQQSKDNIIEVFGSLRSSGADQQVLDYFRNLYPELKSEIGSWELGQDLQNKTLDDIKAGAADAISKFSSLDELKNAQNSANDETQQSYRIVEDLANHYGLTVDALIAKIKELGGLPIGFNINQEAINRFGQAMSRRGSTYNETESQRLDSAINESEYRNQINTFGEAYWDKIAEQIDEAHKANNGLELSQQQVNVAVKQGTEEYIAEAEAAEKVAAGLDESLSSSDLATNLVDQYDKAFKAIGSAYQDLVEKKFDLSKVDLSSITAIKDAIKDLQSNLSVDGIDFNTEAYEHLLDVVTNTASSSEQIKAAFDNMGTALISSLDGVTEENYKVAESFLQTHGVVDASLGAFMAYANGIDEAKAKTLGLVDANGRVSGSTASAEEALVAEMYAGQNTSDALEYLRICMQNVSLQGIDISNALAALQDLEAQAKATGSSISAIAGMQNAAEAYATATNAADRKRLEGRYKLLQAAQTNAYNKQLEEIQNRQKVNPSNYGGAGSGSKGGGGGGSAKDTKEQTDALKELSSQLDEIQSAYASLSEIVEQYNENGKLTIDQAQELINTDFRYLAMLTDENGQLQLNAQGFETLAQAKLHEMQIQLAKNAIDTVNGLQTEADAVNFLTYAYKGLAGAALDATEAQLQAAVAAAHLRGEQQGAAADKIYAGYQATKQAIGNTDFSKSSLSGKKDEKKDDKDKKKKDKAKEEEDTKTRFNWLDRLVSKIQRRIDQLAKRAEKYFSYVQKNALVNKQIEENKRMIATQELASTYYSNKAARALKKVPKKMRNLVSGDFDPKTVKNLVQDIGSGKTKKLQEYLEWAELLEKSQDAITEAYDKERELITNKLNNILDYFDTLLSYQQNIIKGIDTAINIDSNKGLATDINNLLSKYAEERKVIDTSQEREEAYAAEYYRTNTAIERSYDSQIQNAISSYKDSASYQKLKDTGKQGKAKKALDTKYHVLAEDVDAYIEAFNKTQKKKTKAEGEKEIARLQKKYDDYLAELQTEQAEALRANEAAMDDQIRQNQNATNEAREAIWETIKSVLDALFETYERQIRNLDVIVNKWGTIAETLQTFDDDALMKYNVQDIYGVTSDLSDVLVKQQKSIKDQINAYHEEYNLYERMIQAASAETNEEKAALFKQILLEQDLNEKGRQAIEGYIRDLTENQNWDTTSWVTEFKEGQNSVRSSITDLMKTAEDIGDSLLDKINESTNKLIDSLRALQEAYSSKASLINDEWTVDSTGITEYGYAKISALNDAANVARQRAAAYYQVYLNLLNADDEVKALEDYDKQLNESVKNYYDAVKDIHSVYDEIYNIAKQSLQNEVDNLAKLVENYKKALQAKKSYYDYDRQLKDKNKNIQSITAEIKALENVGTAAAKARQKALKAELKNAQDDLDDTVFNHQIEVETDALDKLVADMTEALQDTAKTIQETFERWSNTIKDVTDVSLSKDSNAIYTELLNFLTNGIVSDKAREAEQASIDEQAAKLIAERDAKIAEKQSSSQAEIDALKANYDAQIAAILQTYNSAMSTYSSSNQNAEISRLTTYYDGLIEALRNGSAIGGVDAYYDGGPTPPSTSLEEQIAELIQARDAEIARINYNYNYERSNAQSAYTSEKEYLDTTYQKNVTNILEALERDVGILERTYNSKIDNMSVGADNVTIAPNLSDSGSVANDILNGTVGDISSGISGVSDDVITVISGSNGIPAISANTQAIRTSVVNIAADVKTIAKNTNTMVSQLDAIKEAVASPQINLSIEGEDLYSGMKRVGKVVVYR